MWPTYQLLSDLMVAVGEWRSCLKTVPLAASIVRRAVRGLALAGGGELARGEGFAFSDASMAPTAAGMPITVFFSVFVSWQLKNKRTSSQSHTEADHNALAFSSLGASSGLSSPRLRSQAREMLGLCSLMLQDRPL